MRYAPVTCLLLKGGDKTGKVFLKQKTTRKTTVISVSLLLINSNNISRFEPSLVGFGLIGLRKTINCKTRLTHIMKLILTPIDSFDNILTLLI